MAISGHQWPSGVIRGHQRSSEVIRGNQRSSRTRSRPCLATIRCRRSRARSAAYLWGREGGRAVVSTCMQGEVLGGEPGRLRSDEADEEGHEPYEAIEGDQGRSREIVLTKPTRRVASHTPRPSRWRSRPDSHSHRARRCWAAAYYLAPPPPPPPPWPPPPRDILRDIAPRDRRTP